MSTELKKPLAIKIKKLNINQAYFFGTTEIDGIEHKINIQGHWKEKLIKLPIKHQQEDKVLIRLSGEEVSIEEMVAYRGKSEWIEIDSDEILYYVADNQDKFDMLEVYL